MSEKKLSDEEILKIINEFEALNNSQRKDLEINSGYSKKVYDIPEYDNYVLKENYRGNDGNPKALIEEYIASKQMSKIVPTETPMLIKQPNNKVYLLQKKMLGNGVDTEDFNEIQNKLKQNNIIGHDIHENNVAYDINKKPKILDLDAFGISGNIKATDSLQKARETAIEKIIKSKPRIYRSIPLIGPAIGAGIAAMSGEANAASSLPILGEAESLGPEQGSADYEIENPQRNPAARRAALESLLKK